jgi:signal transduction histidine kinase
MRSLLDKQLSQSSEVLSLARERNTDSSRDSLRAGRLQCGAFLDGAPYPMALWSLDRRSCVLNSPARELLGISEDDIGARTETYLDRIEPADRQNFLSAWKKLSDGQSQASCCYRFKSNSRGETRWLREVSIPFAVPGKNKRGALTIYTEERKDPKPTVNTDLLSGLLPGLTHEIGNHLQAISGELELLRLSGTLPADSAAVISNGIRKILNLALDIQEYFLPSSGRAEDPALVMADVLHRSEEELTASGVRIDLTIRGALSSVSLNGQFARVFKSIIDFSRALLPAGGTLKVEAGVCRRDGREWLQLNVISDSLSNALPVEEDRVFRPFMNLAGYRAGLGMTVAQRIVLRQSGEIKFRKEQPNRGVFSVLMPISNDSDHANATA